MRRILLIALFAVLAGVAAYFLCFGMLVKPVRQLSRAGNPQMAWLVTEFHLSPDQAKGIGKIQLEYESRCSEMCRKISENQTKISQAISRNREISPDIEPLLREGADLQVECRKYMLGHIYAVAAWMPPKEAERYIGLMKMQIVQPGMPHILDANSGGDE